MDRKGISMSDSGRDMGDLRAPRTLPELCNDVFLLILQLRLNTAFSDAESLRRRVHDLFQAMERDGKRMRINSDDVQDAKYILTAFVDETILNSRWEHKEKWAARPLQLEYFGDQIAGEEFFNQLEQLRKRSDKGQLLEVYYMCLLLGYKGKFRMDGTQVMQANIGDLERDVRRLSGARLGPLSLNAEISDDPVPQVVRKRRFPWWLIVVGCLTFTLLLYLMLWLFSDSSAQETIQRLGNMKLIGR